MKKIKDLVLNNYIIIYIIYFGTLFLDATALIVDYPILETEIMIYKKNKRNRQLF